MPISGDADTAELTPSAASPLSEGASEFSADKDAPGDGALSEGGRTEPDVSVEQTANENGGETTFSYDRLISKSTNPVRGIDYKRREVCYFPCNLGSKVGVMCCFCYLVKWISTYLTHKYVS